MMQTGISYIALLLLFLMGGSGDLEDYVNEEAYWQEQGVEITLENMLAELTTPPEAGEETVRWVEQLGADNFDEREAASRHLAGLGSSAKPFLQAALQTSDPEVRMRARKLLSALPKTIPGQDHPRARMAVVALSRMKGAEAEKRFQNLEKGKGPPAEMVRRYFAYRRSSPERMPDILPRFPADTLALAQFTKSLRKEERPAMREIHQSPGIQGTLLEAWSRTGDLRVQRITAAVSADMIEKFPRGSVSMVIEGQFEPDKLKALLTPMGFSSDQDPELWKHDEVSLRFDPEGKWIFVVVGDGENPERASAAAMEHLLQGGEQTVTEEVLAVRPQLPSMMLWAGGTITDDTPFLPELDQKPKQIRVGLSIAEENLGVTLEMPFEQDTAAEAMLELAQSELQETRELLATDNGQESRAFQSILESVEMVTEGNHFQVRMTVTLEAQVQIIQSIDKMMTVFRQIRQPRNQVPLHHDMFFPQ